jgi:hypothetical protein
VVEATPEDLARIVCEHWSVEVEHHIRDVSFGEDTSTSRTSHGPTNLATLRSAIKSALEDAGYLHISEGRRDTTPKSPKPSTYTGSPTDRQTGRSRNTPEPCRVRTDWSTDYQSRGASSRGWITLAGTPAARAPEGTSTSTTAPAATVARLPTVISPKIVARAPSTAPDSILG